MVVLQHEAAARFNISNESGVRHWVKIYKDAGEEGLMNIKLGWSKDMTKSQKTPPFTDAKLEKLSPEELWAAPITFEQKCLSKKVEGLSSKRE